LLKCSHKTHICYIELNTDSDPQVYKLHGTNFGQHHGAAKHFVALLYDQKDLN